MKITHMKSHLFRLAGSLSIVGLLLAGVVVSPAGTALAQTAEPPAKTDRVANTTRLENVYQRELNWLNQQQQNLDRTDQLVSRIQTYIANQQAAGKDVTALRAALATFQQQIATAQTSHQTAASILNTHTGFDANGHVTDAAQARQTLIAGHQSLADARRVLRQAILDLHRALRNWRLANRPGPAAPLSN